MGQTLDADDMQFHMLIGGTVSGKTNSVLHMLKLLFTRKYDEGAVLVSPPKRPRGGLASELALVTGEIPGATDFVDSSQRVMGIKSRSRIGLEL